MIARMQQRLCTWYGGAPVTKKSGLPDGPPGPEDAAKYMLVRCDHDHSLGANVASAGCAVLRVCGILVCAVSIFDDTSATAMNIKQHLLTSQTVLATLA